MSASRDVQIINAAHDVFMKYGPRRTTMEDIADAVGISRPALYQYFRNKKEIQAACALRLHNETLKEVASELDRPGSVNEQLKAALLARDGRLFELSEAQGVQPWFLDIRQAEIEDVLRKTQRNYERLLRTHMIKAGFSQGRAGVTARLLVTSAYGLRNMVQSREEFDRLLSMSVDQLMAGARQLASV